MSGRRVLALGSASVALVAAVLLLDFTVHAGQKSPYEVGTNPLFGSAWILGGLVAWARRPDNRCGPLMVATGWAWLVPSLYGNEPISFTLSQLVRGAGVALLIHLIVAFPQGQLGSRFERVLVVANYADFIGLPMLEMFWNPTLGCPNCPRNLLLIRDEPHLVSALNSFALALTVVIAVSIAVVLIRRWRRAGRPGRRALAPLAWTAVSGLVVFVAWLVSAIWFRVPTDSGLFLSLAVAAQLGGTAIPLAFLAGLLRARLHRGAVAELLIELDNAPALSYPRDAIARALGDPGLQLGFWLPAQRGYVDFDGGPMSLPAIGEDRAVMVLESGGAPLASLVYDPSLLEDRTLLDAVGSGVLRGIRSSCAGRSWC
jgi:uncharacterized membrane protein YhaH (DUF805 family)